MGGKEEASKRGRDRESKTVRLTETETGRDRISRRKEPPRKKDTERPTLRKRWRPRWKETY